MPMTRKDHRARITGPFTDPTLEKTFSHIYQALPAGLTRTITIKDSEGHTHNITIKNGILVEYEVT